VAVADPHSQRILILAQPDEDDPLDPGGIALDDLNADDSDEVEDDDMPFFVGEPERWHECVDLAERLTGSDVHLVPMVARSLYMSDIPTDDNDPVTQVQSARPGPSPDVPDGIED
jgi:hypothetical protein